MLLLVVVATGCPPASWNRHRSPVDAALPDTGAWAALRDPIVQGVNTIQFDLQMSRVATTDRRLAPIVWGSARASAGDKLGLPGTLPAPGWVGAFGAGRLVVWAGQESAFGSAGDGRADNDRFRQNVLLWLLAGGDRIGLTSTHGEWLSLTGWSPLLTTWMAGRHIAAQDIGSALDSATLAHHDLVVVGNPWGEVTAAEIDALAAWVDRGGGLLVLGLGWSWAAYHPDPTNRTYPVNRIGERFGFAVVNSSIVDPAATVGTAGMPGYPVRPLSEYRPRAVRVLKAGRDDVNQVKIMGPSTPETLFVIEGRHMGLNLLPGDWPLLDDPAAALVAFDKIYMAELALVGAAHPPFAGDTVWAIAADDPPGAYWMHAGNPIVFKQEAGRAEIIPLLNREGYPGWGIGHELGHNMHGDACRNLFVVDGTAESWCNVFNVYSYLQNGWSWASAQSGDVFAAGHTYHAQVSPSFAQLTSDPWILLGCLELIWSRHGWTGMQTFLTKAAADAAAGVASADDAASTAYLVEQMSIAYNVNLAPLFGHWGFAVSSTTQTATGGLPACGITW